jgi:hypothetical protein
MKRIQWLLPVVFLLILAMGLALACGDDDDDDNDDEEGDDGQYTCEDICEGVMQCSLSTDCVPFDCMNYCETKMSPADLSCAVLATCDQLEECLCDDDDDFDDDDDDFGDDDMFDDDDNIDCDWVDELTWFSDNCATLLDQYGNEMTTEEVVADCNDCIGGCAGAYYDESDCDGAYDCVDQNCF